MLLEVSDLSVYLQERGTVLLKPITFSLDAGESLVLLGESGSGKTLLCHAVLGLLSSAFLVEGRILFEGERRYDLLQLPKAQRHQVYGSAIAFVPQNPMTALNPSRTVGAQMMETLFVHGKKRREEALSICKKALSEAGLDQWDLIMKHYPYTLSGGMLQRVLIAMVLMTEAKLVITDEPTTALDVIHRNDVLDAFLTLKERGVSILMVTHDFYVANRLGGKLTVLKEGEVIERGNTEEIMANPKREYTRELIWAASYERKRKDA